MSATAPPEQERAAGRLHPPGTPPAGDLSALPIPFPPAFRPLLAPICVALVVAAAFALAAVSVLHRDEPRAAAAIRPSVRAVPRPTEPPPAIEPLVLLEMTPDRARAINAAVPFARGRVAPARAFRFSGTPEDRERALTCLAAAAWYEAGDDAIGERAVAQVVLNRLRHPAYPKTVCGVVFQGSERQTGCQFTFTCDGAMARTPSPAAWTRARGIAEAALGGTVDATVGTATHYHTDWVVPYWSGSLTKIAAVHTHLFFRWPGWWGEPAAFSGRYAGGEPLDARLIPLAGSSAGAGVPGTLSAAAEALAADAIAAGGAAPKDRPALDVPGVSAAALKGNIVRLANPEGTEFGLELDRGAFPGSYAIAAYALCRDKPACIVAGWIRPDQIPAALPVPVPALRTVSFLYRKNVQLGRDQSFWNCRQIARDDPAQCLPGTGPAAAAAGPLQEAARPVP